MEDEGRRENGEQSGEDRRKDYGSGKSYGSKDHRKGSGRNYRSGGSGSYKKKSHSDSKGDYRKRDGDSHQKGSYDSGSKKRYDSDGGHRKSYNSDSKGDYKKSDDRDYRKKSYSDSKKRYDSDGNYKKRDGGGSSSYQKRSYDPDRRGPDYRRRDGDRDAYQKKRYDSDSKDYHKRSDRPERSKGPKKETTARDLTIPNDPQAVLFKGIDCEVNGRADLAMRLYLAGAVKSSKGCENNALKMMRDMSEADLSSTAGRVAKDCDEDSNLYFDFLRLTLDENADRSSLDAAADAGSDLALYCLIRLGLVEGDDDRIWTFAAGMDDHPERVEEGLRLLARKKDSKTAAHLLNSAAERKKRRSSVRQTFVGAAKGDPKSVEKLDALAREFPEAAFLKEHLETPEESREAHLAGGMAEHGRLIISMANELADRDSAFGRYLHAKKLQADGGEWIPAMVSAYRAGYDDALSDLAAVRGRRDVKKQLSEVHLERGDVEALVKDYDGEDAFYLDKWCAGDPDRVIYAGTLMNSSGEIDWLKRGWLKGYDECRQAIVALADDEPRYSKQLVYTLHDIGADVEAAKMYFAMEGDKSLPSVKWLKKVCMNEEAKNYVRSVYEERNDLATFEFILADDGYVQGSKNRPSNGKKGPSKGNYKNSGKNYRRD